MAWYQADYERAEALFKHSLTLRMELGEKRGVATSLLGLAAVASAWGQAERAALLFAAADSLRQAIGVPLPPFIRDDYEGLVGSVRTALGSEAFATAWAKGQSTTLEEATVYALGAGAAKT